MLQLLNPKHQGGSREETFQFELQHSNYSNWVTLFWIAKKSFPKQRKYYNWNNSLFSEVFWGFGNLRIRKVQITDVFFSNIWKCSQKRPFLHSLMPPAIVDNTHSVQSWLVWLLSDDALWSIQLHLQMYDGKGTLLPDCEQHSVDCSGCFVVSTAWTFIYIYPHLSKAFSATWMV